MILENILKINPYYKGGGISYVGCLRNQKRFEIGDKVFIGNSDSIVVGRVIGVEETLEDNPQYLYKIHFNHTQDDTIRICDTIFKTIEEAKESALREVELIASVNRNNVEQFFKQYINDENA